MDLQTNSKVNSTIIIPTTAVSLTVGQKLLYGAISTKYAQLRGYYKGGGNTILIYNSSNIEHIWVLQTDGKLYRSGTLISGDFEYIILEALGNSASKCYGIGGIE